MKVLVTGANGFIGSHLVELLLKRGYAVRCLVRKTSSLIWLKDLPVEHIEGDICAPETLQKAVEGVEYIFHSAGLTKARTAEEYFRGNSVGTRNLLSAALEYNPGLLRFLLVSSQAAAGPSPTITPIDESVPPHPITTYGRSKFQAEKECQAVASSLKVTILRPPVVYGPRDRDVFAFFDTLNRGLQPVVGFKDKYVSLVHVRDLVRGFLLAMESKRAVGQTYFISSTKVYNWREIGEATRQVLGKAALRLTIPKPGVYLVATIAEALAKFSSKPALINVEKARDMVQDYWTCDSGKAKRDFGYEQEVSLEEGIRETVGWYKAAGWLK